MDIQKTNEESNNQEEKSAKNSGVKIQNENIKGLKNLDSLLRTLLYSSKELAENADRTGDLITQDLGFKIRSELESTDFVWINALKDR